MINNVVNFEVMPIAANVNTKNLEKLESILDDLGNWENLVKSSFYLLSELKIGNIQQPYFGKAAGKGLYEIALTQVDDKNLEVSIRLAAGERCIREQRKEDPMFSVSEIYDQITNIGKWRTFKKSVSNLGIKQ
jgi:hypothetical protein